VAVLVVWAPETPLPCGVDGGAVMITNSFAAPHSLGDEANPEPDAGV
jgi:hypothetical protein